MSKRFDNPPVLKTSRTYDDFIKLLKVWQTATSIPKEKQGAALLLTLEDEAQQAALRISNEQLCSAQGLDKVVAELDKLYKKDAILH